MATGQFTGQVFKTIMPSDTPSEVGDYAKREWVATDTGKVFAKQVGSSTEVPGGGGADYFDMMAFPVHLVAADELGPTSVKASRSATASPKAGSAMTA